MKIQIVSHQVYDLALLCPQLFASQNELRDTLIAHLFCCMFASIMLNLTKIEMSANLKVHNIE